MNITEIIKDAFLFPSKNIRIFGIYLLLSILMMGFTFIGTLKYELGLFDPESYLFGGIYLIIAMLIGFIIAGYHIKVIKSGIEVDDDVPVFEWYENFMTGFDNVLVSIFYNIIPALIFILVAFDTHLFDNAIAILVELFSQIYNVFFMGASASIAIDVISNTILNFITSLAITTTTALILFVIFSILQTIAEARLANTDSLMEALNIYESAKDIIRIGAGKVILVIILLVVIIAIIETILITISSYLPLLLLILYIILTPYLVLFTKRAVGLLYSDIV